MFEFEVFRKQMCCIEESRPTCDTVATFRRPHSDSARGIVPPCLPRYAPDLYCERKVNGQQKLTGFVEFFYKHQRMIFFDKLVTSVVERWFRLGLNYLVTLEKSSFM